MDASAIRNRIKEVRKVRFGDVKPHDRNFRRHPSQQRAVLEGVVSEVGFASVPLAYHSKANGGALTWVDGHLRSEAFPDYEGEIAILDIDDGDAALVLATLDPLSALAHTDAATLDSLLTDLHTNDDAVQRFLDQMGEENHLAQTQADESGGRHKLASSALVRNASSIKVVLPVDDLQIFERAIRATGKENRAEALAEMASEYLKSHADKRQHDAEA